MQLNFLGKYQIFLPDEYANERSNRSPHSLSERLKLGIWEQEEIILLKKHLSDFDSVLELGACIGGLSVVTNSMLSKKSIHTVIEANPKLIPVLNKNKKLNSSTFNIVNCIVSDPNSNLGIFKLNNFILGSSQTLETDSQIKVQVRPLTFFKDSYTTLIMDIEGGEYDFISTFKDNLHRFNKLFIEFHDSYGFSKKDIMLAISKLNSIGFKKVENIGNSYFFKKIK
jgi:FkbM family methyltransferase